MLPTSYEAVSWPSLGGSLIVEQTTIFSDSESEIAVMQIDRLLHVYIDGELLLDPLQQRARDLYRIKNLLGNFSFRLQQSKQPERAKEILLDMLTPV